MSTSVIYFLPDYLKNPKEKIHKQRREEIDLYVKSFENIGQQINDCIDKAFVSLNNLKNPAMELNNEINEILKNFNDTKKNKIFVHLFAMRKKVWKILIIYQKVTKK